MMAVTLALGNYTAIDAKVLLNAEGVMPRQFQEPWSQRWYGGSAYYAAIGWMMGNLSRGEASVSLDVPMDKRHDSDVIDQYALCELGEDLFLQARDNP